MTEVAESKIQVEKVVTDVLQAVDREREREIIARRYGIFDRKEQIGELLGITRERVRQLEKAVMTKLSTMAEKGDLPHIELIDADFIADLSDNGKVARISDIAERMTVTNNKIDQSRVAFLARLAPAVTYINENAHYHSAAALASDFTEKAAREQV